MDKANNVPINQIGPYNNDNVSVLSDPSPASVRGGNSEQNQRSAVATTASSRSTRINLHGNESSNVNASCICAHAMNDDEEPVVDDVGSPSAFQSNIPLSTENALSVRLSDQGMILTECCRIILI